MSFLHASMPAVSWDESLFLAINGLAGQVPTVDHFFLYITNLGTFYVPIALTLGYWIWIDWREAVIGGATLAAVVGAIDFLGGQLKWLVERVRPCRALSQAVTLEPGGCGSLYSFPSNHAMNTVTAAAFLQMLYPKSGWISWPVVGLVGFSRVYIGAHYVSDILGSWLIGGLVGASCGAAVVWFLPRRPSFGCKTTVPSTPTLPPSSR